MNNDDDETYILLLLSDSNLPTGSFVASSGLESFVKHGFMSPSHSTIIAFIQDSLASYARTALPFVSDAHRIVSGYISVDNPSQATQASILQQLVDVDGLYEAMCLNHVAKRASKSQGVALLTLYSKGFSRPTSISSRVSDATAKQEEKMTALMDQFKLMVRKEETHGHLSICWGCLAAMLGLTLERTQYLHLFLHARSLLSASVRLNDIGPYGAQQLLLHAVRPIVDAAAAACKDMRTGLIGPTDFDAVTQGPAMTWPLGEILAARHDLQHSRIFNS